MILCIAKLPNPCITICVLYYNPQIKITLYNTWVQIFLICLPYQYGSQAVKKVNFFWSEQLFIIIISLLTPQQLEQKQWSYSILHQIPRILLFAFLHCNPSQPVLWHGQLKRVNRWPAPGFTCWPTPGFTSWPTPDLTADLLQILQVNLPQV